MPIVLIYGVCGEGATTRASWAGNGETWADWRPEGAGTLSLHKVIIEDMATAMRNDQQNSNADERKAVETFKFLMAITLAHEMVHFFIGFLAGSTIPCTPPSITGARLRHNHTDDSGNEIGESGYAWEKCAFGGKVVAIEDVNHPLGGRQAGVLVLKKGNDTGRLIRHDWEQDSIEKKAILPRPTIDFKRLTRQNLASRTPMNVVRKMALDAGLRRRGA
ncbi:hypothetical protein QBC46DRAFT_340533 [Diplogelasinospora grovesii]|uniref:Uncharacterized protein n=1 Tax=Diplogelasinospora grovesii TaxID=303347 RepID=A0AAN6N9Q0_9PEZI|nr:hypothetical protein QBC46DRAFT_340533 [Diplogelasinospora grovesii]